MSLITFIGFLQHPVFPLQPWPFKDHRFSFPSKTHHPLHPVSFQDDSWLTQKLGRAQVGSGVLWPFSSGNICWSLTPQAQPEVQYLSLREPL